MNEMANARIHTDTPPRLRTAKGGAHLTQRSRPVGKDSLADEYVNIAKNLLTNLFNLLTVELVSSGTILNE